MGRRVSRLWPQGKPDGLQGKSDGPQGKSDGSCRVSRSILNYTSLIMTLFAIVLSINAFPERVPITDTFRRTVPPIPCVDRVIPLYACRCVKPRASEEP
jgi:hypothetical protein